MQIGRQNNLSFLDVMACGLGSMLFLFFIFMALKKDIDFETTEKTTSVCIAPAMPLVIMVVAVDKEKPSFRESNAWLLPDNYECKKHNSAYFAVLYAKNPPPLGREIWVQLRDEQSLLSIQVFRGKNAELTYEGLPEKFGRAYKNGNLRLWPVPRK